MWLPHAARKICSERHSEVAIAYYHFARLNGIYQALRRAKLIYDISTCTLSVRRKLARNLVILVLSFGSDYDIDHFFKGKADDLLDDLQLSLLRTEHAEAQLTSLIRALLELSGGTMDHRQHGFAPEYTVNENANLYALILDITRKREFEASDPTEDIGFPKEHLHLPSLVLCGFGIGTLGLFHGYLEHTYLKIPSHPKPENNILNRALSPSGDLAHQHLRHRAEGQTHKTAFETTTNAPEPNRIHIPNDSPSSFNESISDRDYISDDDTDWYNISYGSPNQCDDSISGWEHYSHGSPSLYPKSTSPAAELRGLSQQPQCGEPETEIIRQDLRLKAPKALDWWHFRVAAIICSERHPKAGLDGRDLAQSCGLREQLERAVLVYDIGKSTPLVQNRLAQGVVFLILNLEKHHVSGNAQIWLESDQEDLLERLRCRLTIHAGDPSRRPKLDESQITSVFRGLLEGSGGRKDAHQHEFGEDYAASDNADLCASLFEITRTNQFGDFYPETMCSTLSKSPVFSGATVSEQDLEKWTTNMKHCLCLGFPEKYLGLPSLILREFSVGQIDKFNCYLAETYLSFPVLQKLENSLPLLLTWSNMISGRPLQVFLDWAISEDGEGLYKQLIKDFQIPQGVEQLALTIAALMIYRRHLPDYLDHLDQPIRVSYLADLHALLEGQSLGNSGVIAEQTIFSLLRVLRSFANQFKDLITFLESLVNRQPPLLHSYDEFFDRYLRSRIDGQPHKNAPLHSSQIRMPELGVGLSIVQWLDDCLLKIESSMEHFHGSIPFQASVADIIKVSTSSKGSEKDTKSSYIATPSTPSICPNEYRLVRLSKDSGKDISEILYTQVRTMHEVYNIEELSDGSWELLVLDAYCDTLEVILGKILPELDVDLAYDPEDPTIDDLKSWRYGMAKLLRQDSFCERARRAIERKDWPTAAYYDYQLARVSGVTIFGKDDIEPSHDPSGSSFPSIN